MDIPNDLEKYLKNRASDYVLASLKAVCTMIPELSVAGPILAEWLAIALPGQRLDRVAEVLSALASELQDLREEQIQLALQQDHVQLVLEEGFSIARSSATRERRLCLARAMSRGFTADEKRAQDVVFLMRRLAEITDVEIMWLRYYASEIDGKMDLEKLHPVIFSSPSRTSEWTDEDRQDAIMRRGYIDNLIRLNLLRPRYPEQVQRKTFPPSDQSRPHRTFVPSERKPIGYRISQLGKLLLEAIAETDSPLTTRGESPPTRE